MSNQKHFEKPILRTDNGNCVCVRIWKSGFSAERNVGHVSLQTKGIYASFCPAAKASTFEKLRETGVKGHLNTLAEDIGDMETGIESTGIGEGRLPDLKITLYSLDVEAIEKSFKKFEEQKFSWSAWGSTIPAFRKDKTIRNCSGLVAYLLKAGGIEKLLPEIFQEIVTAPDGGRIGDIATGVIGCAGTRLLGENGLGVLITPDGVGDIVQMARNKEHTHYKLVPEPNIKVDVSITQQKCVII